MASSRVLIFAMIGHKTINIPEIIMSSVHGFPGRTVKIHLSFYKTYRVSHNGSIGLFYFHRLHPGRNKMHNASSGNMPQCMCPCPHPLHPHCKKLLINTAWLMLYMLQVKMKLRLKFLNQVNSQFPLSPSSYYS